ncbi:MAG TPA: thiamine phosphate synthase [Sphingomicrobium sp.]|nr:thiamine phosphate synthase [Sphingomicrobium sp.]
MNAHQRIWPRLWLMTDERMGDALWAAIERLPAGAGLVFRHYVTEADPRAALGRRIADLCRTRAITLAVARDVALARELGADLVHNPAGATGDLPFSRSVHSVEEAERARVEGAALVFVSPVRPTRSHPGQPALAPEEAARIARAAAVPAIALGGMNARLFAPFERDGFHGWAGIDAWIDGED